MLSTLYSNWF